MVFKKQFSAYSITLLAIELMALIVVIALLILLTS